MRTHIAKGSGSDPAARKGTGGGGIYSIKPWFQGMLGGVTEMLVRKRVHPDRVTYAALLVSLLGSVALFGSGEYHVLLLLMPVIVLTRTALNALDGLVARGTGLARPWGEVLNECCDRLSDVALFVGLMFALGSNVVLGVVALVMLLLSSYVGTVAKAAGGIRQYKGVMGKADRMIYLGIASLVAFFLPQTPVFTYFLVLAIMGLVVTIGQRLKATYDDLKSR